MWSAAACHRFVFPEASFPLRFRPLYYKGTRSSFSRRCFPLSFLFRAFRAFVANPGLVAALRGPRCVHLCSSVVHPLAALAVHPSLSLRVAEGHVAIFCHCAFCLLVFICVYLWFTKRRSDMKDIDKICAKYEKKLRRSDHGRSRKCSIEEQVEHYRNALIRNRLVEVSAKGILAAHGVTTSIYPFYYAFARKLDKLCRNDIWGESLQIETALYLDLWQGRGLSRSVLEAIRTEVFGIAPPSLP